MHFTVNASLINTGMGLVSHALSPRPAKTVYEGVLLESAHDGIYLTCTDGEMSIRTRVDAIVETDGVAVMPARLFGELLRKLTGEVEVIIDEKFRAVIRAQGSNTNMAGMDASEFPDILEVPQPEIDITLPQGRLRDAISRIMFAVSTDETRRILTGCLMEVFSDEVRFVGLDGFRLAMQKIAGTYALPGGRDSMTAVAPGRIMGEFSRMLADNDEPVRIACSQSRMLMAFGDTECFSTLLTGEYINYRQIVPASWKSEARMRRDEFMGAIERASLMAREGKNYLLRLTMTPKEMVVTANAERGAARESIAVDFSMEEFKIAFNSRYLIDVVKNIVSDEICMRFNTNVSPCTIAPPEGEQFLYLVLPVRIFDQT